MRNCVGGLNIVSNTGYPSIDSVLSQWVNTLFFYLHLLKYQCHCDWTLKNSYYKRLKGIYCLKIKTRKYFHIKISHWPYLNPNVVTILNKILRVAVDGHVLSLCAIAASMSITAL